VNTTKLLDECARLKRAHAALLREKDELQKQNVCLEELVLDLQKDLTGQQTSADSGSSDKPIDRNRSDSVDDLHVQLRACHDVIESLKGEIETLKKHGSSHMNTNHHTLLSSDSQSNGIDVHQLQLDVEVKSKYIEAYSDELKTKGGKIEALTSQIDSLAVQLQRKTDESIGLRKQLEEMKLELEAKALNGNLLLQVHEEIEKEYTILANHTVNLEREIKIQRDQLDLSYDTIEHQRMEMENLKLRRYHQTNDPIDVTNYSAVANGMQSKNSEGCDDPYAVIRELEATVQQLQQQLETQSDHQTSKGNLLNRSDDVALDQVIGLTIMTASIKSTISVSILFLRVRLIALLRSARFRMSNTNSQR
jgi:chromosome segregation ATPase